MSRSQVEAWLSHAYSIRLQNDAARAEDLFTPDARFNMAGAPGPGRVAARAVNRVQIGELLTALVASWEWMSRDELSTVIEGNKAAVLYRLRARFLPTNEVVETEIFDLITFSDAGKIVDMVEFCDTALTTDLILSAMSLPARDAQA